MIGTLSVVTKIEETNSVMTVSISETGQMNKYQTASSFLFR